MSGLTALVAPPPAYRPGLLTAARLLGRATFGAAFDLQVLGRDRVPRTGPLLLAANHTSVLDGPLVVVEAPRAVRAVTKAELFTGPQRRVLHGIGLLPVRRSIPDRAALLAAARVLTGGGAVAIFPEGTRGTGRVDRVHRGVGWLAVRTGAPVLPVACLGSAEALPRSARPHLRVPVTLAFGEPFTPAAAAQPTARTVSAATERIRLRLLEHLAAADAVHRARVR